MQQKRVLVLIDSQNLYHAIKRAFPPARQGEKPRFDERTLVNRVCNNLRAYKGDSDQWITSVYLYDSMPNQHDDPERYSRWKKKKKYLESQGVVVPEIADRSAVLLKLAVDLRRPTREMQYDIALIFSQNQFLADATDEAKAILKSQGRPADVLYSVYPESPDTGGNFPGIYHTNWYTFNLFDYDMCRHSQQS